METEIRLPKWLFSEFNKPCIGLSFSLSMRGEGDPVIEPRTPKPRSLEEIAELDRLCAILCDNSEDKNDVTAHDETESERQDE